MIDFNLLSMEVGVGVFFSPCEKLNRHSSWGKSASPLFTRALN